MQIAQVKKDRLLMLANLLDTVQENQFNLVTWGAEERHYNKYLFGLIKIETGCGFSGCAMGWAAQSGIFPGLTWNNRSNFPYGSIMYRDSDSLLYEWPAVKNLFGLNENMAFFLFSSSGYRVHATPSMVASRLRRLVKKIDDIRARDQRK